MTAVCGFETHGWACVGGLLCLNGGGTSLGTPCPRCRTEAYLTLAWKAVLLANGCTCRPSGGGDLWTAAVGAARAANPAEANAAISVVRRRNRFTADAPN